MRVNGKVKIFYDGIELKGVDIIIPSITLFGKIRRFIDWLLILFRILYYRNKYKIEVILEEISFGKDNGNKN